MVENSAAHGTPSNDNGQPGTSFADQSSNARPLRQFVVSGIRLVREGLGRSINRRKDVTVCGSANFSKPELAAIVSLQPDVALVDLANLEGLVAARVLRSLDPTAQLISFSANKAEKDVFPCAAAGFCGFVTRDARDDDLLQAARNAVAGRLSCTPQMAAAMFNRLSQVLIHPDAGGCQSPGKPRSIERNVRAL